MSTGLVVEVGCGDGEFALVLSEVLESTDFVGFEPKLDPKFVAQANNIRFVNNYIRE